MPPSAIAEGSCSLPTISGIEAEATGAWKAKPIPSRKTPARMISGVSPPKKEQTASRPALPASQQLKMRSNRRQSARSASAPAGTVNRKNGKVPAEGFNQSQTTGIPREFIAQVAAISWAETQQHDTTNANHQRR